MKSFVRLIAVLTVLTWISPLYGQTDIEKLSTSPRHQEWVDVTYGDRTVHSFLVFPEISEKSKVVIVIHENRGLNDWARVFTDELASKGYIAIAPDLLSDAEAGIAKTTDFENPDKAREALYKLDPDRITSDLNAVFEYAKKIAAGNGEVSVVGFCWGGSQSFRYATNNPDLEEAFVFYGTAPTEESELNRIDIPVYGFYGGADARVNATIEKTEEILDASSKVYEYEIYDGGGHGFMRSGAQPDASEENKKARDAAWQRLLTLLKK